MIKKSEVLCVAAVFLLTALGLLFFGLWFIGSVSQENIMYISEWLDK